MVKGGELEGIADAKIDAEGVEGGGDVEIGSDRTSVIGFAFLVIFISLVRRVDGDTEVETDDKAIEIKTQSGSRSEGNLAGKIGIIDDTVVQVCRDLHFLDVIFVACGFEPVDRGVPVPHITGIEESRSVEFPDDGETEFEIGLELEFAGMEELLVIFNRIEITRAVRTGRGRAQTIRSAGIESLGERRKKGVSERYISPCIETRGDADLLGKIELITQFGGQFDELVESDLTEFLILLVPRMAEGAIEGVDEVAGLLNAEVDGGVDCAFGTVVIVDKIVANGRHELIAGDDFDELRVFFRFIEQVRRLGLHEHDGERERRERMRDIRVVGRADKIRERAGELVHTVSAGDVLVLVAQHITGVAFGVVIARPMEVGEDEGGVKTEFVRIGFLRVARMAVSQRPEIGSVGLEREQFAFAEEVLDGRFEREVRTETIVRAVSKTGVGSETVDSSNRIAGDI